MCSTLTAVLFTFNLQTKSAPKICPGPQNVEMGHVTLTMPTQGIVSHHKASTLRGQLVYKI